MASAILKRTSPSCLLKSMADSLGIIGGSWRSYAKVAVGTDIVSAAPGVSLQKSRTWDEGVSSKFSTTPLKDIFKGKKVVIFGLPDPTAHNQWLSSLGIKDEGLIWHSLVMGHILSSNTLDRIRICDLLASTRNSLPLGQTPTGVVIKYLKLRHEVGSQNDCCLKANTGVDDNGEEEKRAGAYTGVCSQQHVPSYKNIIDKFKAKGIDSVICVAVNDPYTMNAWAEKLQAKDAIEFYGDFDGSLHKSLELNKDLSVALLGHRSERWSAYVEDGKVKVLNVEEAPSDFKVSGGEVILGQI
ncbi:hypothetical protein POTOM_057996 [Populus tomentosa]|uniref:Glutaredoxin-dependent peroxiredoxin n=1 Tax=Populus tomentosa TaxID=118781 RepID=A0A8X8C2I2_POPTO|nr:hypothetical protein POTOM_057996 [Populus tomentosa]